MDVLEIKDVTKSFGGLIALDEISLTIPENSLVGLIGPNGCGKTTLFNVITGVFNYDSGSIKFLGNELKNMTPHKVNQLGISRTYQDTRLFKELTVIENLMLPPKHQIGESLAGVFGQRKKYFDKETDLLDQALGVLDLLEIRHMGYEYAKNLSGGQGKLVDLGRVLMSEPKLLLLDEPTAGVNPVLTQKLFDKICELRDQLNLTILIIEHDMDIILRTEIDLVYVANNGRIIVSGKPKQIRRDKQVIEAYLGR